MRQQADEYQAEPFEQNAASDVAGAQRTTADTTLKGNLTASAAQARASSSSGNASAGSNLVDQTQINARASYDAAMALWRGENAATGDLNRAQGPRYSGKMAAMGGEEAQEASYLAAAGMIGAGVGSMASGGPFRRWRPPAPPACTAALGEPVVARQAHVHQDAVASAE
jgi:hypothetical protein